MSNVVHIPVSPAELFDKITILELKAEYFDCQDRIAFVTTELNALSPFEDDLMRSYPILGELKSELHSVNKMLWRIEEELRQHERDGSFGETFVRLARSVYTQNDLRWRIKQKINEVTDSELREQKSYLAGDDV